MGSNTVFHIYMRCFMHIDEPSRYNFLLLFLSSRSVICTKQTWRDTSGICFDVGAAACVKSSPEPQLQFSPLPRGMKMRGEKFHSWASGGRVKNFELATVFIHSSCANNLPHQILLAAWMEAMTIPAEASMHCSVSTTSLWKNFEPNRERAAAAAPGEHGQKKKNKTTRTHIHSCANKEERRDDVRFRSAAPPS